MNYKSFFLALFFVGLTNLSYSQYYEWAKEGYQARGHNVNKILLDKNGNSFLTGFTNNCSSGCIKYFLQKVDSVGNYTFNHTFGAANSPTIGGAYGVSSDMDSLGNIIATGHFFGTYIIPVTGDTIFSAGVSAQANFIIKYNSQGNILWAIPGRNDNIPEFVSVLPGGQSILTSINGTRKIDGAGNQLWSVNTVKGNDISRDSSGNFFIITDTSFTKMNSIGGVVWNKHFGGFDINTALDGTSYIANNDTIYRCTTGGVTNLTIPGIGFYKVTFDTNGNIYAIENSGALSMRKYDQIGTLVFQEDYDFFYAQDLCFKNYNGGSGLFITGDSGYPILLCPIFIPIPYLSSNPFLVVGKMVQSTAVQLCLAPPFLSLPYQFSNAGIWSKCQGDSIDIAFDNCTGSFNPGNTFFVELSDSNGIFTNPTIIGSVSGLVGDTIKGVVPTNVPSATGYRVRMRSTNPAKVSADNGYDLQILNIASTISLSGNSNTTFCRNKKTITCNLTGVNYQWKKNGLSISGATTQVYTPPSSGTYTCMTSQNGCTAQSINAYNLNVLSLPSVSIVNNGSDNLCWNDSTQLQATSPTAFSYLWKKYNQTVSGTVNNSIFYATKAGGYKAIVTDLNGCTKVSNVIDITGPPSTIINVSGSLLICPGDSVTFYAALGTGYTYQWYKYGNPITGATSPSYVATTAGKYKAQITNGFGCTIPTQVKTVSIISCPDMPGEDLKIKRSISEVYPNPTSGILNVAFEENDKLPIQLQVYNLLGQMLTKDLVIVDNPQEINLSSLQPGLYFMRLIYKDNKSESKLFEIAK